MARAFEGILPNFIARSFCGRSLGMQSSCKLLLVDDIGTFLQDAEVSADLPFTILFHMLLLAMRAQKS